MSFIHSRSSRARLAVAASFILCGASIAFAGTVTWDGGAGTDNWNDELNWSTDTLPGPGDDVVIDVEGDITVRHTSGITDIASLVCEESFIMQAGTIIGDLTFNGPFEMSAGRFEAPGTLTANASVTLTGSTKDLWSTVVINDTLTWTSGTVRLNGNTFTISNGATFDVQGDLTLSLFSAPGTLIIDGLYARTSGNGFHSINADVQNNATLDAQTGNVRFQRSLVNDGDITGTAISLNTNQGTTISASGTVDVDTLVQATGNTEVNGALIVDALSVSGGILDLTPTASLSLGADWMQSGGTCLFNLGGDITFDEYHHTGGVFEGDTNIIVNTLLNYTTGRIDGPGTLEVLGDATMPGSTKDLWRDTSIHGTCTWTSGTIRLNGNQLAIAKTALVDVQGDLTISFFNTPGTLVNDGEYRRSAGSGTHSMNVAFENNALFDSQSGTTRFQRQVTNAGTMMGTALNVVVNQTCDILPGSELLADVLTIGSGTTNVDGTLTTSAFTMQGGTCNFNAGATVDLGTSYAQSGGTCNYNLGGTDSFDDITLTGGFFVGTTGLVCNNAMTYSAGRLEGPAPLVVLGDLDLTGTTKDLWCDVTTHGTTTWSSGTIRLNGNTWTNQANATIDVQGDLTLSFFNTPGMVQNLGTYQRSSGTGNHSMNVVFQNEGLMHPQTGTVRMQRELHQMLGELRIDGAFDSTAAQVIQFDGGLVSGHGTWLGELQQSAVTIGPGSSPGLLTVDGALTCSPNGVVEIELAGLVPGTGHDVIAVTETAALAGQLIVSATDGFMPVGGDTFTILTAPNITGDFDCPTFNISDTIRAELLYTGTEVIVVILDDNECLEDVNADGMVDVTELLAMLAAWGPVNDCTSDALDFNNDDVVGVDDLLMLLSAWGPC